MGDGAEGKFKASRLEFKVSETEFVVGCGTTGSVGDCGRNTAKAFAIPVTTPGGLESLKAALKEALADLEALEQAGKSSWPSGG